MSTIRRSLLLSTAFAVTLAAPLAAKDNHAALKDFFEGRRVIVRIDMPGTKDGVNVYAGARRDLNLGEYRDSLRRYGVALRAGESAVVTLVKVKDDLIEFQLNGGGYGTFFDDTDTSVYIPFVEKSSRERALERELRNETDRNRRRQIERELDSLRDRRERENRRIAFDRERLSERKEERVFNRRLDGGSRFNIRFQGRVPYDLRPDDIMAALAEYVDFDGRWARDRR
jgi:hypothetical protein